MLWLRRRVITIPCSLGILRLPKGSIVNTICKLYPSNCEEFMRSIPRCLDQWWNGSLLSDSTTFSLCVISRLKFPYIGRFKNIQCKEFQISKHIVSTNQLRYTYENGKSLNLPSSNNHNPTLLQYVNSVFLFSWTGLTQLII